MDQDHIVCPRCKYIFQPSDHGITDTTLEIWQAAGPKFWRGKRATLRELANQSGYSTSTVRRHLHRLIEVGLVEKVGLSSNGHSRTTGPKQYHAYRGTMFKTTPALGM